MDVQFRRATREDLNGVISLLVVSGLDITGVEENIKNFFVAVVGDKLVGVIGAEYFDGGVVYHRSIAIDPDFRGVDSRKISISFLALVAEAATQRQCRELWGLVRPGLWEKNKSFLRSSGYEFHTQEEMPAVLHTNCEHIRSQKFPENVAILKRLMR